MPLLDNFAFNQLSKETIYIAFSVFIAIIIWFEGMTLRDTEGKMPSSTWFHLGSLVDTAWFFVSIVSMYFLSFQSIAMVVPIVYIIYTLFGWFYGTSLMSKDGLPDSPDDLVIPLRYIAYSQSFAIIFFALCLFVLAFPTLPFELPFKSLL